jgi:hypothetical protein
MNRPRALSPCRDSCRPSSKGQRACRNPAEAVFCSRTPLLVGPRNPEGTSGVSY